MTQAVFEGGRQLRLTGGLQVEPGNTVSLRNGQEARVNLVEVVENIKQRITADLHTARPEQSFANLSVPSKPRFRRLEMIGRCMNLVVQEAVLFIVRRRGF